MRRPRLVLGVAIVVLLVLGILGIGVEKKLTSATLSVPGTESARGDAMLREHFGESSSFAILLRGPAAQLDRQGPRLIEVLRRDPGVTTISPWDRGAGLEGLRPNRETVLILADFKTSQDNAIKNTVPRLAEIVENNVTAPVEARTAGYASVARGIQDELVSVTRRGEAILVPILLVVLLLVFRSPVAAAIPLVFGATTAIAARGLMAIVAVAVDISGFALSVASMLGLALGVDYALLIVSRYREELDAGADPAEAASLTRRTAGRTTVFAGSTLLMSVLAAAFLVPGELLASLCATVVAVIVLAVGGPWVVGPALLVLVGRNIDRWRIGRRGPGRNRWMAVSRGALRHPALTTTVICLLLLVVAVPAMSFKTAVVTIRELPPDNQIRRDVETIERAVGTGWIVPSIVVLASERKPVTAPRTLAGLARWQVGVSRDPSVDAVIGPGPLAKRVMPLRRTGQSLFGGRGSGRETSGLAADLDRAGSAIARLRRGLGRASEGAHSLAVGSGRAQLGASLLERGLALASSGGERARRALERFNGGARRLANGQRAASFGASLLTFSTAELSRDIGRRALPQSRRLETELQRAAAELPVARRAAAETLERLEAAWKELGGMGIGASDPRYPALAAAIREGLKAASGSDPVSGAPYAAGYEGLPSELSALEELLRSQVAEAGRLEARLAGIEQSVRLVDGLTNRLHGGIESLDRGSTRLAGGSERIVAGAERIGGGLARLDHGAARLATGLRRLQGGNEALARGLSFAFQRTRPLVRGARAATVRLSSGRDRLQRSSPGIFDSGYFVLAALDGAPPTQRRLAGQAVDLGGGGAAKVLVVSGVGLDESRVRALDDRLRRSAARLGGETGMETAVTGGFAQLADYSDSTTSRLPALVIAITAITFLAMILIVRAVPLAAVAVVLNLFTVAAAFGILKLLTFVPEGVPFGGANHLDPAGAAGIFGVVFGISIDYAVFLLRRMRESWERDGDDEAAIVYGLERTARVVTGAATIMVIVFVMLGTMPIVTVAQFGMGLAVAVILDATVVRLMLLPAVMKLIGPSVWWMPPWLSRVLPRIDPDGSEAST